MALFGAAHVPGEGFIDIARNAEAIEEEVAEIVLRPRIAGTCRYRVVTASGIKVSRYAPAIFMAAAEHIVRLDIAARGSAREPRHGRRFIFRDAFAGKQHAPQPHFGFRQSAARRRYHPWRGRGRIAGKDCAQFFSAHHGQRGHAPRIAFGERRAYPVHLRTRLW